MTALLPIVFTVTIIMQYALMVPGLMTITYQGDLYVEVVGSMMDLLPILFTMTIIIHHELMVPFLMTITDQVALYVKVVGAMMSLLPMVTIIIQLPVQVQVLMTPRKA